MTINVAGFRTAHVSPSMLLLAPTFTAWTVFAVVADRVARLVEREPS